MRVGGAHSGLHFLHFRLIVLHDCSLFHSSFYSFISFSRLWASERIIVGFPLTDSLFPGFLRPEERPPALYCSPTPHPLSPTPQPRARSAGAYCRPPPPGLHRHPQKLAANINVVSFSSLSNVCILSVRFAQNIPTSTQGIVIHYTF